MHAGIFFSLIVISLITSSLPGVSQDLRLELTEAQTDASFRGLSVVDDEVAWVSGTKGWIGKTVNGGAEWSFKQVPGFEKFDFRAIYAFDKERAVIANAGAPANILYTSDGGGSWMTVYTNHDTLAFIDGVDFFNEKEGIIYGDPMRGKMLLLYTSDGGKTWNEYSESKRPRLLEGEASFAASGTNIRCINGRGILIATGGKVSRIWLSQNQGGTWTALNAPILQGESSQGIFSVAFKKPETLIVVGGDYTKDTLRVDHVFISNNMGRKWTRPQTPTRGYRECVEFIDEKTLLATGPSGTDVSVDAGKNWTALSDEKAFHVVRKARKGDLIVIAGGKGKVGIIRENKRP